MTYVCTGDVPSTAVVWDEEEEDGLSGSVAYGYAGSDTARKCEFHCVDPYEWDVLSKACVDTTTSSDPTADIDAAPDRVRSGNNTTVTWSAQDVSTSCRITKNDKEWLSDLVQIGGVVENPSVPPTPKIVTQTTFKIYCDGSALLDSVTVNIVPGFVEF